MNDLLAARSQMGISLGFHIVFAEIGIAMPLMMVLAEWRWRRTGDPVLYALARRWSKGVAILFAVGAVSGTVLSFELGLLFPRFMEFAGPIIGIPFSLEGFAFFTEAIFLGLYLYGWDRISPRAHMASGLIVAVSGAGSAVFVVMVNAWMNAPTGLVVSAGKIVGFDVLAGMQGPVTLAQVIHMLLAAYAATGMAIGGLHAFMLLQGKARAFHGSGLAIALVVGVPAAILQPLSGDMSARAVARTQPVKLAAMEAQFATERGAPLRIGGWPDVKSARTRYALEIPRALSFVAYGDASALVKGLSGVPRSEWPPVLPVHFGFQIMVGLGIAMTLVSLWAAWSAWRRRVISGDRRLLRALVIVSPFGFIATEAGWVVTEVGRQPWSIQGLLRTADSVTPMPGLVVPFVGFTALYVALGIAVIVQMHAIVREEPDS